MSFNRGQDYRMFVHNNFGNRNNNGNHNGWGRSHSGGGQRRNNNIYGGGGARRENYYERSSFAGNNSNNYRRGTGDQNRHNEHRPCDDSYVGVDSNKRGVPAAAAADAGGGPNNGRHQRVSYSSKKHKSHETYYGEDLSPEQMQYRKKVASQLPDGERIEWISKQAFLLRPGWDALMEKAAQYAIEGIETELKKAQDSKVPSYSDYESSDSDISVIGNTQKPGTLTDLQKKYLYKLPECHLLRIGFHIEIGDNKYCICPCCKQNAKWRKQNDLDGLIDKDIICDKFTICEPLGIMSHLRKMGGMYEEKKDRKLNKIPMKCIYHYGARLFMEYLYKDYNGEGIGHKALYQLNDDNYKKAERATNRRKEQEKRTLKEEITVLKQEKSSKELELEVLKKCNKELADKLDRLKQEKERLGIEQKPELEISDKEMKEYRDSITGYFASLRHVVDAGSKLEPIIKPVVISIEPAAAAGDCSYLLQQFLDDLYNKEFKGLSWAVCCKRNPTFKVADFEICHKLMFGDMLTDYQRVELKESMKGKKLAECVVDNFDISIGLISKWNVMFTKAETYGKTKNAKAQLKKDMAVDEGGPSRQFLSDAWKQLHALAVPVMDTGGIFRDVKIFKQEEGALELIPIVDEEFTRKIKKFAEGDAIEEAKHRAKLYARAMGRMMLHSFIHKEAVSSGVMTPFFMNLMLRGIGPGDSRYDHGDIVKHMDGILCKNAKQTFLSDMLEMERDDRDDGSKWEKDTIFSDYVPNNFIKVRSLVLGGLMDGLSLNGRSDVSESLERGSELSNILRYVPLDAVTKIFFARPALNFDDVQAAMLPVYGKLPVDTDGNDVWEGSDEDLAFHISEQEQFYENQFLSFVRSESNKDAKFLSKFVECCTGSCYLPYMPPGSDPYQIIVEFNLGVDKSYIPSFHTCTREVVFPGLCYERDADEYQELLVNAIESSYNNFDMK